MGERNRKFRNNKAMAILGVPDIGVLNPVDVHVELVVGLEIKRIIGRLPRNLFSSVRFTVPRNVRGTEFYAAPDER